MLNTTSIEEKLRPGEVVIASGLNLDRPRGQQPAVDGLDQTAMELLAEIGASGQPDTTSGYIERNPDGGLRPLYSSARGIPSANGLFDVVAIRNERE